MDLGVGLAQEGGQAVAVAVPDHQKLLVRGGVGVADDIEGVVAPQEGGVLVLLPQEAVYVEAAYLPGVAVLHGDALPGDIAVHSVRPKPVDAGGGVEGAVEVLRHCHLLPQGEGLQAHGLRQGGIAVVGPQAGPVVVRAVEDILPGVGLEGPGDIHPQGPGVLGLLQVGQLVKSRRALGQLVPPDLLGGGDQPQVYRQVRLLHQAAKVVQVLLGPAGVGDVGDQGVAAEVDVVELPVAQQVLIPGLQPHPAVPQGELVRQVLLQIGGEGPVHQARPGEHRGLAQIPVLHRGEGPVRQEQVEDAEATDKQAEDGRRQALGQFCHRRSPP